MQRLSGIPKSPFKIIYKLAKEKNKDTLENLVREGLCVGAFDLTENSVMLLAKEGDFESVNFLVEQLGANMNHALYGAALGCHIHFIKKVIDSNWPSLNYAIRGMAACGNVEVMEELIDRGASLHDAVEGTALMNNGELVYSLIKRGALVDYAVRGAASVGNVDLADELLIRGASLSFAAEGAARGGFSEYADKLVDRALTRGNEEWLKAIESALMGAAHGWNVEHLENLIHSLGIIHDNLVKYAIYGAASGGHTNMLTVLSEGMPASEKNVILAKAAHYAAQEGHFQLTTHLFADSQLPQLAGQNATYGAASGGNLKLALEILSYEKVDLSFAVRGAASGYQVEILNRLTTKRGIDLNSVVNEMAEMNYLKSRDMLRFISFIDNIELRKLLSNKTSEYNPEFNATLLFSRTTKKNELMRRYNLTFSQAQAYLNLMANGGYGWLLLQGNKFFCSVWFSFRLYLNMILHLIGTLDREMNIIDVENIYVAAHQRLRDQTVSGLSSSFFSLFQSHEEIQQKKQFAEARYKNRIKYLPS